MSRAFANGLGDPGSNPGQVIPKTQKMVLDSTLPSTQYYKVRIEGKVEQSKEWSSAFPVHHRVVTIEKGNLWFTLDDGPKHNFYLLISLKKWQKDRVNTPKM